MEKTHQSVTASLEIRHPYSETDVDTAYLRTKMYTSPCQFTHVVFVDFGTGIVERSSLRAKYVMTPVLANGCWLGQTLFRYRLISAYNFLKRISTVQFSKRRNSHCAKTTAILAMTAMFASRWPLHVGRGADHNFLLAISKRSAAADFDSHGGAGTRSQNRNYS